jgi:acetyl esterase
MSHPTPLHPQLQAMIERAIAAGARPLNTLTPTEIRATDLARYAAVPKPPVARVEDRLIPGPVGDIRIRLYHPGGEELRPVITFFHGSGFVICSIETHDGLCRQLCLATGAIVVSVDYRLAPEHKFPAAVDDCEAATRWVYSHAREFGGDPLRIAVAGDSAGGNLAVVTALRLRNAGHTFLRAQLLMYPVTDYPDPEPPSFRDRAQGFGLGAADMHWFWSHYLPHPGDGAHADASPLRAASHAGLPAAYVMTAEYDPLRDEGDALAAKLAAAGVATVHRRYDDMNHGFMSWVGLLDRADEALRDAAGWLISTL